MTLPSPLMRLAQYWWLQMYRIKAAGVGVIENTYKKYKFGLK